MSAPAMTQVPLDRWHIAILVAGISPIEAIRVIHAVARDLAEQERKAA